MVGSYLMFDPVGRWMVNKDYKKCYLSLGELVKDGIESNVDLDKYYGRDAVYEW